MQQKIVTCLDTVDVLLLTKVERLVQSTPHLQPENCMPKVGAGHNVSSGCRNHRPQLDQADVNGLCAT